MKFFSISNVLNAIAIAQLSFIALVNAEGNPKWPFVSEKDVQFNGKKREVGAVGRIVNGTEVDAGTYPWFTSIVDYNGDHHCGGMLIAPDIVLTAAHCMVQRDYFGEYYTVSDTTARIGALKYPYQPGNNGGQDVEEIEVAEVKIHPQYKDELPLDFDFAVLKLAEPSTIQYANIDDSDKQFSDNYVGGEKLWTIGLGDLSSDGPVPSELMHVEIDYITNEACVSYPYGYPDYLLNDNHICAADLYKDSCQGDSGGPLYDADKEAIVGVVSWGFGCADPMYPGVYARISTGFRWIREFACTLTEAEQLPDFCDITVSPTVSPAPTEYSTLTPTIATSSPTALNCGDDDVVMAEVIIINDYNPWETVWALSSNSFLATGSSYYYSDEWWKECIPINETYTFSIYDNGGDGLQSNGNGSYRIVVDGKLIKSGGSFTFAEHTVFDTNLPPFICKDSTQPFLVNKKERDCEWVGKEAETRCARGGDRVWTHCPKTCGKCDAGCRNSGARFKVNYLNKFRTCLWVGTKDTDMRCAMIGNDNGRSTCPKHCGGC